MKLMKLIQTILIPSILLVWIVTFCYMTGLLRNDIDMNDVTINQKVEISSILNNTYNVETYVFSYINGNIICEKIYEKHNVKCNSIPKIKKEQMEKAIIIKQLLEEKLVNFKECDK